MRNRAPVCRSFRGAAHAGFTLVEALVSLTITAVAGTALLLGIASALATTETVVEETIAWGLAQQLMDEMAGARYAEPNGGSLPPAGLDAGKTLTGGRETLDDLDDYDGLSESPPLDQWGVPLGADDGEGDERHAPFQSPDSYLARWRQEVSVYEVSATDFSTPLSAGQSEGFRLAEVRILVEEAGTAPREILLLKRVFAHVPTD